MEESFNHRGIVINDCSIKGPRTSTTRPKSVSVSPGLLDRWRKSPTTLYGTAVVFVGGYSYRRTSSGGVWGERIYLLNLWQKRRLSVVMWFLFCEAITTVLSRKKHSHIHTIRYLMGQPPTFLFIGTYINTYVCVCVNVSLLYNVNFSTTAVGEFRSR